MRLLPAKRAPGWERLGVLDGMRGIAIALVVWYHLRLVSGCTFWGADVIVRAGFLGVDLFFFVSGFCIAYPYVRARAAGLPPPRRAEFVRRRALKIVPSYVLALLVFGVVYHARFDSGWDELTQFLAHLAFVHVWSHATFGSFSGPLWTLGVEVQFYALFALLGPAFARRPVRSYLACLAVAVVYRTVLAVTGADADFGWLNQLPAVVDVFAAGLLAAAAFVHLGPRVRPRHVAHATGTALGAAVLAVVACVGLAIAAQGGDDGAHRWLNAWRVAFGPVLGAGTLGAAFGAPSLRRWLASPVLGWLSTLSYNAYLWNLEIAVGLQNAGLPGWAVFAGGAAGTFAVALAITHGFERPLMTGAVFGAARERLGEIWALVLPRPAAEPSANA
jgi:peptidoglycan/LPS O-acetylase OafA/YrhL